MTSGIGYFLSAKFFKLYLSSMLMALPSVSHYGYSMVDGSHESADKSKNISINKPSEKNDSTNIKNDPISFVFTGDILLDKSVGQNIQKYGPDYPFTYVGDILKNADITVGNLETSVSVNGSAAEKEFTFRSKPGTLKGLVNAGYDMVGLANNHTLDYGQVALSDTLKHLREYEIAYSGAGANEEEAFTASYHEVNGKKIAILSLSRVLPNRNWFAIGDKPGLAHAYEYEPMMKYVKKAVENSDYTMLMIHWNKEYADYPEEYAKTMARKFIDAGVDAVIGGHPHTLQGIEMYKEKPIFYSLGNFVFTQPKQAKGSETMIVKMYVSENGISSSIVPAKIINGQVKLMDEKYKQSIISKLNKISFNVKFDEKGNITKK